jgi:hypothetical protein
MRVELPRTILVLVFNRPKNINFNRIYDWYLVIYL